MRQLGGAMGRVPAEATAFGDRSAPFHLSIDASWIAVEDDERNIEWARSFWTAAQRFSSGQVYFNFAGLLEEGDAAIRTSYGRNYERLVDVKTAYHPENVFRLNPNIAPGHDEVALDLVVLPVEPLRVPRALLEGGQPARVGRGRLEPSSRARFTTSAPAGPRAGVQDHPVVAPNLVHYRGRAGSRREAVGFAAMRPIVR